MEDNREENSNSEFHSTLRFLNYVVNSVEFHTNEDFEESSVSVDFNVKRQIEFVDDENNTIYVTLNVDIFDGAKEKNYPFSMKISVTGIFEVDDIDSDLKSNLAQVNAVAILFPYLRSLVSTYTANANVTPLILPAINVMKLIEFQEK